MTLLALQFSVEYGTLYFGDNLYEGDRAGHCEINLMELSALIRHRLIRVSNKFHKVLLSTALV